MTKGKNKKIKTTKIYLFLLPPLPSQDGGSYCNPPPPHPQPPTLFTAKIFAKFFHRYMGIWTKGGKIDRMAILAKTQKMVRGKIRKGEGCNNPPPLLLRERVKPIILHNRFYQCDQSKLLDDLPRILDRILTRFLQRFFIFISIFRVSEKTSVIRV